VKKNCFPLAGANAETLQTTDLKPDNNLMSHHKPHHKSHQPVKLETRRRWIPLQRLLNMNLKILAESEIKGRQFSAIFDIFGHKIGVFRENQCNDQIFA
jgi:hypothetical protein